jgi:hypothetical protein
MSAAALPRTRDIAILLLAQLLSYGIFAGGIGFRLDDWSYIERIGLVLSEAGGFWRAYLELVRNGDMSRPLGHLWFLSLHMIGGTDPLPYQILLQLLQLIEAVLLFALLDRLFRWRRLALIAAILSQIMPNRDIVHVWYVNSAQLATHILILMSLLAHDSWIRKRRAASLLLSLSLYFAGFMMYESCVAMPAMLGAAVCLRRRQEHGSAARAFAETLRDFSPYLVPFLLGILWQWVIVSRLGSPAAKTSVIGFSPHHFIRVYLAGAECVSGWLFQHCAGSLREFLRTAGAPQVAAWAASAVAIAYFLLPDGQPAPSFKKERSLNAAIAMAASGFLAAYAPYSASLGYVPTVSGLMSRTNGTGAWIGGIVWSAVFCHLSRRRPRLGAALILATVAAFTCANWHTMSQYRIATAIQSDIVEKAATRASRLPAGSTMILGDYPAYQIMAVVFDAEFDFAHALRLRTGRTDLLGSVASPRMSFGKDRVRVESGGELLRELDYGRLYLYRYRSDALERLHGPPIPLPVTNAETSYQRIAWF